MPPPLRCAYLIHSPSLCTKHIYRSPQSRSFSSSPSHDQRITRNRRALFRWLNQIGLNFESPAVGSTNYLGAFNAEGKLRRGGGKEDDETEQQGGQRGAQAGEAKEPKKKAIPPETPRDLRPFPLNHEFRSQPVLTPEFREKIWMMAVVDQISVRDISWKVGVEMNRVAAVIRLVEIEKEWIRIGKPLARPYAQAVLAMLPKTPYVDPSAEKFQPHEPINDLPIHSATGQQIFHPTSESRVFTRADAAKIFHDTLKPADDRIPHPQLVLMHKDSMQGKSEEEVAEAQAARDEQVAEATRKFNEREAKRMALAKVVSKPRWDFKITPVRVEDAGKDGRGHKGVGWRYGMPLMDRSRAQVKIPTKAG